MLRLITIALLFFCLAAKPRLLVLTDNGGDPDDQQSLIRLMHYSNEFEIEGLVASASGIPGELKEAVTKPHLIREIVEAYAKVRPNLVKHAEGFPTAESLLAKIKSGNPNRGLEAVGEGKDTEGSRWIIQAADKDDPRPLDITIWGGQSDLAQALWRVRHDRGADGYQRFIKRLRIYDIGDQDKIADWMFEEFPGLFYILPRPLSGADRREASYRGMYLGGDESLVSRDWMETHIRQNHGPLAALYPPRTWTAPNPHSAIKEGDTPSWFYFLPHGLNDPAHPEWGSWGGRFTRTGDSTLYRDAQDAIDQVPHSRHTVSRWRPAFQADFQSRLDWAMTDDPAKANHAPLAVLNGDRTNDVLQLNAKMGQIIGLSADGTTDPDAHRLQARWFIYPEPSTAPATLESTEGPATRLTPKTAGRIHVILETLDQGTPPLYAYRRAVITVE